MNKGRGLPKANMAVKQRIVHYTTKECQTSIHAWATAYKQDDMLDGLFYEAGMYIKIR